MMGKSHLALGWASVTAGVLVMRRLAEESSLPTRWLDEVLSAPAGLLRDLVGAQWDWASHPVSAGASAALAWLLPWPGVLGLVAWLMIGAVLVGLGSLLPDADAPRSMLGRHVPRWLRRILFRGPHRGWTHTDWFLLGLFALSLLPGLRALAWVWLGAWSHDWSDGCSRAGRARFYPLGSWRVVRFDGGGDSVVLTKRRRGFYTAKGGRSEAFFLAGAFVLCIGASVLSLWPWA